jgi:hypothetical protein
MRARCCATEGSEGDRLVDGSQFDAWTRDLRVLVDRRVAGQAFAGGALACLGLAASLEAEAKKKKKKKGKKKRKKKGCQFAKTPTLWTLKANCTTRKTIEIPDGVTLDGDGKTIKLVGSVNSSNRPSLGTEVLGTNVGIRRLTLDGSGLTGSCSDVFAYAAIFFTASGEIDDVAIADLPCGIGIIVAAEAIACTIKNSTIESVEVGVFVNVGAVTADDNSLTNVITGLERCSPQLSS